MILRNAAPPVARPRAEKQPNLASAKSRLAMALRKARIASAFGGEQFRKAAVTSCNLDQNRFEPQSTTRRGVKNLSDPPCTTCSVDQSAQIQCTQRSPRPSDVSEPPRMMCGVVQKRFDPIRTMCRGVKKPFDPLCTTCRRASEPQIHSARWICRPPTVRNTAAPKMQGRSEPSDPLGTPRIGSLSR